jgi:quinol monooxygenase YgiN
MYNVSITRLCVRSIFYMPLFILHAMRTMTQAQKAPGVLGVETRFEMGNVVWTKTVWTDEAAMKKYRGSGAHQAAMRLLSEMCSEAAYARWMQDTPACRPGRKPTSVC